MEDEIVALSAIYGAAPGESLERVASRIVRVKFPRFSVTFDLPEDYPDSGAPKVGISSEDGSISRNRLSDLSRQIEEEALKLSGMTTFIQGDQSGCDKPPFDTNTNVEF